MDDAGARMAHSVVYLDYYQTVHLLRAARNRVINTLDGCLHDEAMGSACIDLCNRLHNNQLIRLNGVIAKLRSAIERRDREGTKRALNELHRCNRMTVRLTRAFECDLDLHKPIGDELDRPPPMDVSKPIALSSSEFYAKLTELAAVSGAAPEAPKPRPGTPRLQ